MPRAAVGPADTLSHTEQGWEKKKKFLVLLQMQPNSHHLPQSQDVTLGLSVLQAVPCRCTSDHLQSSAGFPGTADGSGICCWSKAGASAQRKEPKDSSSEGLLWLPTGFADPPSLQSPLPRGWARGNPSASRGRQQKKLDSSKIKPESVAEHCLKFPRDFKDDEGC